MDRFEKIDILFICLISLYLLILFITICVILHQNDIRKEKERIRRYKVIKVIHPQEKKKKTTRKRKAKSTKKSTKKSTTTKKKKK